MTGVRGVDELLEGKGIPRGYIIFVLGGPGSGKTTLALQFLYNGAVKYGENGVYVSLDEDPYYLRLNAKRVGMDLESLEREGKLAMLDSSPIRRLPGSVQLGGVTIGKREFQILSLIDLIKRKATEVKAKRLVVDPLATFVIQYPTESERRTVILDLMQGIAELRCTTLLVSELSETAVDRTHQFEEYLAQGVISMRKILRTGGLLRVFSVEKMRGIDHDPQPHPYKISKDGVEVYPTEMAL